MLAPMDGLARTPPPPYWAVVFTSRLSGADPEGYAQTAQRMERLASAQAGYLGLESARDGTGLGVTVSYWKTLEDVHAWRDVLEHRAAQARGRDTWYAAFELRICRVESARSFEA